MPAARWGILEFEGVELDAQFIQRHICHPRPSPSERENESGGEAGVPQQRLLSICDDFVQYFLVDHWNMLMQLDSSVTSCLEILNGVQAVLEGFLKQLESVQSEIGDVREQLTQTSVELANCKVSESVLWGVISQLLLPPETVHLLTKASDNILGQQYKMGLQLLMRYLQHRHATWKNQSSGDSSSSPVQQSPSKIVASANQLSECSEQAMREVRISFKNCKPYYDLIRVLDNVTVLACVKIKHFLCEQLKVLTVPNTNICIQQEHSLKEHIFLVYFLKYAPGLLRHTHSGGTEGEKLSTLIPYRIVRELYKEFRMDYCDVLSSVYVEKFKNYAFSCNASEYSTAAARGSSLFTSVAAARGGSAGIRYVLPQLSDMVTVVSGVEPWHLGPRGDILVSLLMSPLIPVMEQMQRSKHSYEETVRSLLRLMCDVVTHEYLFSFQLFCGDSMVFSDTFSPVTDFVLQYISEIVLRRETGEVYKMMKERLDTEPNELACQDGYGLLILIRMCYDFSHFMKCERHLSCLDRFFHQVLRLLWPIFQQTVAPQRIALRCVAPAALAACLSDPSMKTIEKKMGAVHPIIKCIVEYNSNILAILLGAKTEVSVQSVLAKRAKSEAVASEKTDESANADNSMTKRSIRERACAMIDADSGAHRVNSSIEMISLLDSLSSLRDEAFLRLEELATQLTRAEKVSPEDSELMTNAFLLNNAYYVHTHMQESFVIQSEEDYARREQWQAANPHQAMDLDVPIMSRCPMQDVIDRHESLRKEFIKKTIRKHFPPTMLAGLEEPPAPSTAFTPQSLRKDAEEFQVKWARMFNGIRDTIHELISDPANEKTVIAQTCMQCLLLNTRYHDAIRQSFEAHPEAFEGIQLRTLLITNPKILSHIRSFSTQIS